MLKVFISYKWVDKDKVYPLVKWLESELGIEVWIDWTGVRSEEIFTAVIEKAIRDCKVFIFMYSKAHEVIEDPNDNWPYREISYASTIKKSIMFVELESCVLAGLYRLKFPDRQVRHANNSQEMDELVKDVRRLLHLPQPNTIPPKTDDKKNKGDVNWLVKRLLRFEKPLLYVFVLAAFISVLFGLYNIFLNRDNTSDFVSEMFSCPDENHPHLIDLGLPSGTKWACCNVGADKPEAYGVYYAWGETEKKDYYDWGTYIHCDSSNYTCHDLGSDIAGTQYDVAHVKWGGSWVMPSYDQIEELVNNSSYKWTTMNGVKGGQFTGPSGGTIFLPATGIRYVDGVSVTGSKGLCWSSTQDLSGSYGAYGLRFDLDNAGWIYSSGRIYGRTVRPVSKN